MKIGVVVDREKRRIVSVHDRVMVDLAVTGLLSAEAAESVDAGLVELLTAPDARLAQLNEQLTALIEAAALCVNDIQNAQFLAPYRWGAKVLCQVVNYFAHGEEASINQPSKPFFFYKPASSVAGTDAPLYTHPLSKKLDYECELAAVIGVPGRDITPEDAYRHIAGYLVMNDVSYRDLQFNEGFTDLNSSFGRNWTKGKGLDNSCILGPWITLADEVPDPYRLRLRTFLNGETVQDESTSESLFKLPELVAEASLGTTLQTGDIIATGTPSGVGLGTGIYLKPGDKIECEIDQLGRISNLVTDERTEAYR